LATLRAGDGLRQQHVVDPARGKPWISAFMELGGGTMPEAPQPLSMGIDRQVFGPFEAFAMMTECSAGTKATPDDWLLFNALAVFTRTTYIAQYEI
jgi:hypothetical protein